MVAALDVTTAVAGSHTAALALSTTVPDGSRVGIGASTVATFFTPADMDAAIGEAAADGGGDPSWLKAVATAGDMGSAASQLAAKLLGGEVC